MAFYLPFLPYAFGLLVLWFLWEISGRLHAIERSINELRGELDARSATD